MKKCNKCGESKSPIDFYKDKRRVDGLYSYCKKCTTARNQEIRTDEQREHLRKWSKEYIQKNKQDTEWLKKYREYHNNYLAKYRERKKDDFICRYKTKELIRKGIIKIKGCMVCGNKAEIHHPDYTDPSNVMWLCKKHHMAHHRKYNKLELTKSR